MQTQQLLIPAEFLTGVLEEISFFLPQFQMYNYRLDNWLF